MTKNAWQNLFSHSGKVLTCGAVLCVVGLFGPRIFNPWHYEKPVDKSNAPEQQVFIDPDKFQKDEADVVKDCVKVQVLSSITQKLDFPITPNQTENLRLASIENGVAVIVAKLDERYLKNGSYYAPQKLASMYYDRTHRHVVCLTAIREDSEYIGKKAERNHWRINIGSAGFNSTYMGLHTQDAFLPDSPDRAVEDFVSDLRKSEADDARIEAEYANIGHLRASSEALGAWGLPLLLLGLFMKLASFFATKAVGEFDRVKGNLDEMIRRSGDLLLWYHGFSEKSVFHLLDMDYESIEALKSSLGYDFRYTLVEKLRAAKALRERLDVSLNLLDNRLRIAHVVLNGRIDESSGKRVVSAVMPVRAERARNLIDEPCLLFFGSRLPAYELLWRAERDVRSLEPLLDYLEEHPVRIPEASPKVVEQANESDTKVVEHNVVQFPVLSLLGEAALCSELQGFLGRQIPVESADIEQLSDGVRMKLKVEEGEKVMA